MKLFNNLKIQYNIKISSSNNIYLILKPWIINRFLFYNFYIPIISLIWWNIIFYWRTR